MVSLASPGPAATRAVTDPGRFKKDSTCALQTDQVAGVRRRTNSATTGLLSVGQGSQSPSDSR